MVMETKNSTTPAHDQPLYTTQRKTYILGFVTCIKSIIAMANQIFLCSSPFKYLLSYKFTRGGWNNM